MNIFRVYDYDTSYGKVRVHEYIEIIKNKRAISFRMDSEITDPEKRGGSKDEFYFRNNLELDKVGQTDVIIKSYDSNRINGFYDEIDQWLAEKYYAVIVRPNNLDKVDRAALSKQPYKTIKHTLD
jgi:hypothetical protein